MDGSFKPPKEKPHGHWKSQKKKIKEKEKEKQGYGTYNPIKNLQIDRKTMKSTKHPTSIDDGPPSHLQLLTTTYQNEAVHVFTCCPNVLYLLNAQLKHPILHNNHPNKTSFEIYGPNATTMYTNHHAPQKSKPMPNLFQKVWWYSIQATPNK